MYEVEIYDEATEGFIDNLSDKDFKRFMYKKELLERFGPMLAAMKDNQHARKIDGTKLFELKVDFRNGRYRFFHFYWTGKKAVIVHYAKKMKKKLKKSDIEIAERNLKDYRKQHEK